MVPDVILLSFWTFMRSHVIAPRSTDIHCLLTIRHCDQLFNHSCDVQLFQYVGIIIIYKEPIMTAPVLKPIKHKEYSVQQTRYQSCGSRPMRAMISVPSGSGKTILTHNRILDIYKGRFRGIYRFRQSICTDHTPGNL